MSFSNLLRDMREFYSLSQKNFCYLVNEENEKVFFPRALVAIENSEDGKNVGATINTSHMESILRIFLFFDIEKETQSFGLAKEIAEFLNKYTITPLDFIIHDKIGELLSDSANEEIIEKITRLFYGESGVGDNLVKSNRKAYYYSLLLYSLICFDKTSKDDLLTAKDVENILLELDSDGNSQDDVIKLIFEKLFNKELVKRNNYTYGRIASSLNLVIPMHKFVIRIQKEINTKIQIFMNELEYLNPEIALALKKEIEPLLGLNDDILNMQSLSDNNVNALESVGKVFDESNVKLLNFLFPLSTIYAMSVQYNMLEIQRIMTHFFNPMNREELLQTLHNPGNSCWSRNTTELEAELKECDTIPVLKDRLEKYMSIVSPYILGTGGILWWKIYYEKAFNTVFLPEQFLNEYIK